MVHARQVLTPSQVVLVRLGRRLRTAQRRFLTLAQVPAPKRKDHGLGNLVLNREYVIERPLEAQCPPLIPAGDVDELDRDAEAVLHLADAALEQCGDAELPFGGGDVERATELERRAARSDTQAVHVRQCVDHLLRHALAEILLIVTRAHVRERKNRDRRDVVLRRPDIDVLGRRALDRCDEAIADAGHRLDVLLVCRAIPERLPQHRDVVVQVVFFDSGLRPHRVEEFLLGDQLPGILD